MAERWATAPLVFVVAPACPFCGAGRPITVRSLANGDGSVTRLSTCRQCLGRYKLVIELPEADADLPEFGNADADA